MKIFVINLKRSADRREYVSNLLKGIDFDFFEGEDIANHPDHEIYSLYAPSKTLKYKGYTLTTPELGCFASQINLWRHCVKINEPILICEDNIELYGDLKTQLDNINTLVSQYGIVKLGNYFERKHIKIADIDDTYSLVSCVKSACGNSAYAITPEVANNYLSKLQGFFEPVDDFIDNEWSTEQTLFSYYPNLVARSNTSSTIGARKIKGKISLINKLNVEAYRLYRQIRQHIYNIQHKKNIPAPRL
ncbi:glycosyltransferase family 25 protein [Vibrio alfacsensis]|uniref:glycosyltransferase family 25 protein n=1 Tax=Vibrio alfacsensis TaxID=1074311 RepID=UPI002ADD50EE|nr:glycosyltransferase family 25 protein [Vibrio alfacsensis]WQE76411.1 glycosyltransferase family 25 protein [Vibrio alfacsensis]